MTIFILVNSFLTTTFLHFVLHLIWFYWTESRAFCDFEDSKLCGYTQDTTDKFNWIWHRGSTGSQKTGPRMDHTLGTISGHYMYIEASSPRLPNDTARLISPSYAPTAPGQPFCLQFYYNMYGVDVGALNVYMTPSGRTSVTGKSPLWERNFNQGPKWNLGEITLYPVGSSQVRSCV